MDNRLIVALDFATVDEARALVTEVGPYCQFYKVGLELLFNGGQALITELREAGKNVFIDAKLLDIGATVQKATANIVRLTGDGSGVNFLTCHVTDRKTLKAAVEGRGSSELKLLGVTVMTNLEIRDLVDQGIADMAPADLVLKRARLAFEAGFDGVISSAKEAAAIREITSPDFLIVTPGIRPFGSAAQDQARVMTPGEAIRAGADYLVVGRPVTGADDPALAAKAIAEEITGAKLA